MPKYLELYPQAVPAYGAPNYGMLEVEPYLYKITIPGGCTVCDDTTVFFDPEFFEWFCSGECRQTFTDQWAAVYRENPDAYRPEELGTAPDALRDSTR